ncbi:DUF3352 domain-containing protein [Actinorugispora endophytica]|uniref:Uncharacterized protein DUF3352 n=1 Tax=Actinorugispora endophytica TaxID=1605990 RepID=A0A4R6V338_9ACTN|nr:DUF3352 domain-containing protein [Actinorugispora endophytica]TDQ54805.1 uncharacterized protein DUF3352 [Actinorugispora endophytica]
MSYPDQPNQPPQWGQPPSQGQPVYGYPPQGPPGTPYPPQPAQAGPPPRRSRVWMIPVAVVAALALMATMVWASTSVVDRLFGGPQPETVLPGSALVFAKVDLKPTGGQWASYTQFYDRLPDTVKDELGGEEEDFAKTLVEEEFDYLDYETDVEPWLGQRFGVAAWESTDGEPAFAIAIAAEDEDRAAETLARAQSQEEELYYVVEDGFAVITDTQASLNDLDSQVARYGTLDKNETFAADIDEIGSGIANMWMDVGAFAQSSMASSSGEFGSDFDDIEGVGEVTGRVAAVLRVESEYLEFRADSYDMSVDGVTTFAEDVPEGGISALGDLPDNSVIAVGGDGLDGVAQSLWDANRESIEGAPDYADFDGVMREMGVTLPRDFHKLIGTRTAVGFTDFESLDFFGTGDVSFELRLDGADQALWSDFSNEMGADGYGGGPAVTTDGDTTVLSMGTAGTGLLGDDAVFQQTMSGLESSHLGFYMDLRFAAEEGGEAYPEQWGGLGGAIEFSENGGSSTVLRWVPNPS